MHTEFHHLHRAASVVALSSVAAVVAITLAIAVFGPAGGGAASRTAPCGRVAAQAAIVPAAGAASAPAATATGRAATSVFSTMHVGTITGSSGRGPYPVSPEQIRIAQATAEWMMSVGASGYPTTVIDRSASLSHGPPSNPQTIRQTGPAPVSPGLPACQNQVVGSPIASQAVPGMQVTGTAVEGQDGVLAGSVEFLGMGCAPAMATIEATTTTFPSCTGPYAGYRVVVYAADGKTVAREVVTDARGTYRLALRPGRYVVFMPNPEFRDQPARYEATVAAGRATRLDLIYDSGAR